MGLLIFGIIMFVLLVVLHEYGHFLVAKRNGVDVEEFGVGFPPKLYGKKLGKGIFEGYYTINALPLGGFVRLKGEHDADTEKGTFGAATTAAKTRIMLAGVAVNLVTALVLFTVVAWVGMPQVVDNQFTVSSDTKISKSEVISAQIVNDSPAAQAGLIGGDVITRFNDQPITSDSQLLELSKAHAGQKVDVIYVRKGETAQTSVQLSSLVDAAKYQEKSYLGVVLTNDSRTATLDRVLPGSVAAQVGLQSGDTVIALNDQKIDGIASLKANTSKYQGQTVALTYVRNGQQATVQATLLTTDEVNSSSTNPYFGFSPSQYRLAQSTWSAPIVAVGLSAQFTWLTLKGIGGALANLFQAAFSALSGNGSDAKQEASEASQNVSGPVGIFVVLREGARLGFQFVLFVIALISLTLAIMNFLPIPALDGGRTFVMLLFRAMKKPLRPETEEKIHGTGFAILMVLFVLITIVDVRRFF